MLARCCLGLWTTTTTLGRGGKAVMYTAPIRRAYQQRGLPTTNESASVRTLWNKAFGKYLLITNIVSSGVLMVIGDVCAQEIEYRRGVPREERYDMARIWRMFAVGALQGPLHHYVYKWMDGIWPISNARSAFKKILVDQFVMSPVCIVIFFYSACYLEQKTIKETNAEMIDKFPVIYLMDWMFWPVAQYINFRYVPSKYRVMVVNICTAVYNIFLSYMKHDFHEF